jgi:hypothetical protein
MGIDFFFPDEPDASRFTPWTIYDPGQIILAMENRKFTVKGIKKTMQMSGRNKYTHHRSLVDAWIVQFEGERNDAIDVWHPQEASAYAYSFGKSYTTAGILGTVPSVPRDVTALLEELARRAAVAAAEVDQLIASGASAEAVSNAVAVAQAAAQAVQVQIGTTATVTPRRTNIFDVLNETRAGWWTLTRGGASGWYADADPLNNTGQPYATETGFKGPYYYYQTATYLTQGSDLAGYDPISGDVFVFYVPA